MFWLLMMNFKKEGSLLGALTVTIIRDYLTTCNILVIKKKQVKGIYNVTGLIG